VRSSGAAARSAAAFEIGAATDGIVALAETKIASARAIMALFARVIVVFSVEAPHQMTGAAVFNARPICDANADGALVGICCNRTILAADVIGGMTEPKRPAVRLRRASTAQVAVYSEQWRPVGSTFHRTDRAPRNVTAATALILARLREQSGFLAERAAANRSVGGDALAPRTQADRAGPAVDGRGVTLGARNLAPARYIAKHRASTSA
jgi:hypothetical protein